MGIRQSLNESRPLVISTAIVILIASVVFVIWFNRTPPQEAFITREFFTDDDGTTWFVDDGTKIAPFDHNGKQAVLARVFKCRTGTSFVGYLEKFTPEAQKKITELRQAGPQHGGPVRAAGPAFNGIMVKKPHFGDWVRNDDPAAAQIKKVTCPGGGDDFEPVPP